MIGGVYRLLVNCHNFRVDLLVASVPPSTDDARRNPLMCKPFISNLFKFTGFFIFAVWWNFMDWIKSLTFDFHSHLGVA